LYTAIVGRPVSANTKKLKRGRPPKAGGADLSIPARLSPKLVDQLDTYAEETGISRSEAVRRLIEAGLRRPPKVKR